MPLPPWASRRVTAVSWSRPSRARNSFFCSALAVGSRNRLTQCANRVARLSRVGMGAGQSRGRAYPGQRAPARARHLQHAPAGPGDPERLRGRSEEHTSELQSRLHLVCRLLLEKKKKKKRKVGTVK